MGITDIVALVIVLWVILCWQFHNRMSVLPLLYGAIAYIMVVLLDYAGKKVLPAILLMVGSNAPAYSYILVGGVWALWHIIAVSICAHYLVKKLGSLNWKEAVGFGLGHGAVAVLWYRILFGIASWQQNGFTFYFSLSLDSLINSLAPMISFAFFCAAIGYAFSKANLFWKWFGIASFYQIINNVTLGCIYFMPPLHLDGRFLELFSSLVNEHRAFLLLIHGIVFAMLGLWGLGILARHWQPSAPTKSTKSTI